MTLDEEIQLIEPTVVPPVSRHDVESPSFGHQIGRAEADGWSADTTNQDAPGLLAFGPYISLSPGAFTADFRLMVDNRDADNVVVVRIEAVDSIAGNVLAKRDVKRMEFVAAAGTYQDFALAFQSPSNGHRVELRTYWHDRSYVRQDRVTLHWPK